MLVGRRFIIYQHTILLFIVIHVISLILYSDNIIANVYLPNFNGRATKHFKDCCDTIFTVNLLSQNQNKMMVYDRGHVVVVDSLRKK